MRVVFRVDSSHLIGAGHAMRCLTLADELVRQGHACSFISRRMPGDLIDLTRQRGHTVHVLPALPADGAAMPPGRIGDAPHAHWLGCEWERDADESLTCLRGQPIDVLMVDHYAIDAQWEDALRAVATHIGVIDDLADRPHRCELLLDQNLYLNMAHRYVDRVPATCRLLLGPGYVLLRPEFVIARRQLNRSYGRVRRILVFFGTDHTRQTQKVLEALPNLPLQDVAVDVVSPMHADNLAALQRLYAGISGLTLHGRVSNMAEMVARADLGVGAGGSAMWERCYLGLPTLTVTFADNQVLTTEAAAQKGVIRYLGRSDAFSHKEYEQEIGAALAAPQSLQILSKNSLSLVECGTGKVAEALQALVNH